MNGHVGRDADGYVAQYRMVFGRLVLPMKPQMKKIVKFVPKPRVWKLKDKETARLFTYQMAARNDGC